MNYIRRVARQREFMIFVIIVIVFVTMSFVSPVFSTPGNLLALLLGFSLTAIIAVGMTILFVGGGFDMSVGSCLAFTGIVTGWCIKEGVPVLVTILIVLMIGAAIGLFNGVIIAKIGINPFVTTLASLSIFRGLTLILSRGQSISGLPSSFTVIGQKMILGIQAPIWYAVIIVIIGDILLRKSRFFRQYYYIGGNEKAAKLSGIAVDRVKIIGYVITGVLGAVAGIVMTARLATASVTAGSGLELQIVTAVIIGGASLKGGEGSILGGFLGCLLMALISNVLNLIGVDVYWQTFVIGAALLTAVLIDTLNRKRRGTLT
jgi:Ribose/xylose/arabinose/galactoside ABC-type transport systems, permease components